MAGAPEGYVEVAERITAFYKKYPDGSLQCKEHGLVEANGETFFVYVAQAYRNEDDPRPAEGIAWEPVPGKTNFTRDSEAMNAETSAWGRAIAALGFEVHRGIASANEVRNRSNNDDPDAASIPPSDKQLDYLVSLAKEHGADSSDQLLIRGYAAVNLTGGKKGSTSKVIDKLKQDDGETLAALASAAHDWQSHQSDVPAEGFDQAPLDESDMPWEPSSASADSEVYR